MINIVRPQNAPESLKEGRVQKYNEEIARHREDPDNFPKPSPPAAYRSGDILEAFDEYFFSKCYLTEKKYYNSWAMDVDHFVPKQEDPSRIFDWDNLFPCDHDANMVKPKRTPSGGYLNPCDPMDDVEIEILYNLTDLDITPGFEARHETNMKARNSAELLDLLHNGRQGNPDSLKKAQNILGLIRERHKDILLAFWDWRKYQNLGDVQKCLHYEEELKRFLSRKASFTMLMRSIPLLQDLPPEFFD